MVKMKINNVLIKNFKSIKELKVPFNSYGTGLNKSSTAFLVGINESGKSAILEALSLINDGFEEIEYSEYCFLEAEEKNETIELIIDIDLNNITYWRSEIESCTNLDSSLINRINFFKVTKKISLDKEYSEDYYEIEVNDDLPLHEYIFVKTKKNENGKNIFETTIEKLKDYNEIDEEITEENASLFLSDDQVLLSKEKLEEEISTNLYETLEEKLPVVQLWRPSSEYLINETIDLNEFKQNPKKSIPLKNIFHIYGKRNDEEIESTIDKALSKQQRSDELRDKMSAKVTAHINNIWKEHKIKIKISLNSTKCKVHIEDKDKKFSYFNMSQRSDGFKQFISLILSLSAENNSKKLKDKIILIDEPEVHLHPSGIQYMRDEILKIGKNNHVIVATHSPYMVDTTTPERHWIVEKNKSQTSITQIDDNTPLEDDKVLRAAFGLNLFKELLPKNIIVVEGGDDKNIISHALKYIKNDFFYSIKSAGGASKIPGFARLLGDEHIPSFILFDSDKEGRDNKRIILNSQQDCYSNDNVFTLNDLCSTLPNDSTIEDILPINFVKTFFEKEMDQNFDLKAEESVIIQLKNQNEILKKNKQKLESLKVKLSNKFCSEYIDNGKINNMGRVKDLIENLVIKIESKHKNNNIENK